MNRASTPDPATPPSKHWLRTGLNLLLPVALVVAVDRFVGWGALLDPWQRLSVLALLPAIALLLVSYGIRALRLKLMLADQPRLTAMASFRLTVEHNFYNNLMPMRTGEISFPVLANRYCGIPISRSIPTLLLFRTLDLHSILWLGMVCLGFATGRYSLVATGLGVLALTVPGFLVARALAARITPTPEGGRLRRVLVKLLAAVPHRGRDFALLLGITVLNWALKLSTLAWLLAAMADVNLVAAWLGATAGELSSALPIHSWAGFGTYEAGITLGLSAAGGTLTEALPVAVNLHLVVLGTSVVTGLTSIILPNHRGAIPTAR